MEKCLFKEIGFRNYTIDNQRHYYEQPKNIEQRHSYLQRMRQNRLDKRPNASINRLNRIIRHNGYQKRV